MSFNPAITAAAPRLNPDVFSTTHIGSHPPIPHALEVALRNSRFEQVLLNPQPLPPRQEGGVFQQAGRATLDDDWCGTVPKRFPPPPPSPFAGLLGRASR